MSILRNAFIVLLFAPAPVFAGCTSDRDCPVASHCDRTPGQASGICTGGMLPDGPYHHMNPDPYDRSQQEGEGCVTDADCGYSGRCQTTSGQMRGVCLGGMGGASTGGGVRIGIPH
jgi:hypothetical protein